VLPYTGSSRRWRSEPVVRDPTRLGSSIVQQRKPGN
jgi:hypothetical protein